MHTCRKCLWIPLAATLLGGMLAAAPAAPPQLPPLPAAAEAPGTQPASVRPPAPGTPRTVGDLKAIEEQVLALTDRATRATVGLALSGAMGSGVIVSKEGLVLTAAHVSRRPGEKITFILHDGQRARGVALGMNSAMDAGLAQITDKKPEGWPFVPLGTSADLKPGAWCLALGHPLGYRAGRPPVLRAGRVLSIVPSAIWTDCTLISGDSGGPLFNLEGKVIGIHSRIGPAAEANFHVPIDVFTAGWERMLKSEAWGAPARAFMGLSGEKHEQGLKVTTVMANGPAARAGVQIGDVITTLEGKKVATVEDLQSLLGRKKPGAKVKLGLLRGEQELEKTVVLGDRSNPG